MLDTKLGMNFGSNVGIRLLSIMRPSGLRVLYGLCVILLLFLLVGSYVRFFVREFHLPPDIKLESEDELPVDSSLNFSSRTDVGTCTAWGAPIMWDGIFDPEVYDKHHKQNGTTVAMTVFAIGRYLEMYLMEFLSSAERHFMVGLPVTYYVFTDVPEKVPMLVLRAGRTLEIIPVEKHKRWQDVSMMRMKTIADAIRTRIQHRYVFCLDVDQIFKGRFGSEALGESVAVLHACFYNSSQHWWTYDHNRKSAAYMEKGKGDFYYHAAVFGGTWQSVENLTESCHQGIMADKKNKVEALWHDESHLNKYFWLNKPSKVLSPEYAWYYGNGKKREIRVVRLSWAEKHYNIVRAKNKKS